MYTKYSCSSYKMKYFCIYLTRLLTAFLLMAPHKMPCPVLLLYSRRRRMNFRLATLLL